MIRRRRGPRFVADEASQLVYVALQALFHLFPQSVSVDVLDHEVQEYFDGPRLSGRLDHLPGQIDVVRIREVERTPVVAAHHG